jgi:mxaJ protein
MRRATCSSRAEMDCTLAARCVALAILLVSPATQSRPERVLRVCADPNNLPFSSEHTPGFENQIASVLARQLGARLSYTWWAQRRGFFRNTLKAKACDVVIGVPVGLAMARTTAPYYRSAYAFVTRADRGLTVRSLDDPRLHGRPGRHRAGCKIALFFALTALARAFSTMS